MECNRRQFDRSQCCPFNFTRRPRMRCAACIWCHPTYRNAHHARCRVIASLPPHRFGRPTRATSPLPPSSVEAGRMRAYVPPFRFTSFFSPEDALLCMIAAEAALARARTMRRLNGRALDPLRIVELTTGSGLVGLHLLRLEKGSRLIGLDIDQTAIDTAQHNSRV